MSREKDIAEGVRQACLKAALDAYESGGISGLCAEGRWELAVQAIRTLDLDDVPAEVGTADVPAPSAHTGSEAC